MYQIIMLYTLNVYNVICQLYLNNEGGGTTMNFTSLLLGWWLSKSQETSRFLVNNRVDFLKLWLTFSFKMHKF